jgi:hypothetical protein
MVGGSLRVLCLLPPKIKSIHVVMTSVVVAVKKCGK